MSRFNVIPKNGGDPKYSGTPTFTGTYMKPGVLEFREVASPTPVDWTIGDYVVYSRTGLTYRLYNVPQLKKQARSTTYGGAFVYQSVQFYDDSKQLEICPFRDLVTGDNRIHFSTQPSISTFEPVSGLASRFQACLEDMYGSGSWVVRVATVNGDHISQDLANLMAEAREFTVSGMNIQGCLDKVYEIWPEVGWVFKVENSVNTIVIGGGGVSASAAYLYGRGNGLTAITRTVANADELANRLFVYGSSRNMLPGWYNSQNIKDATSVDIRNLMVPVDAIPALSWPGWGKTSDGGTMKPDASKAYVQDDASVARIGLHPKTYYFDGSGDLPEIYPTIRNVTIADVRASNPDYVPSSSIYTDGNARVDKILSAPLPLDNGLAGDNGKSSVISEADIVTDSGSGSIAASAQTGVKFYLNPFFTKTVTISDAGTFSLRLNCALSGTVTTQLGYVGMVLRAYKVDGGTDTLLGEREARLGQAVPDSTEWNFGTTTLIVSKESFLANQTVRFEAMIVLAKTVQGTPPTFSFTVSGTATSSASFYRANTVTVNLRQIGFDIEKYAALGDGKTLAMRTGKCAGRTFQILSSSYVYATDSWTLELSRSEDESLSQWFPNSVFPIEAGDEFVLLDIAMPESYIKMAERRLLESAQDLLLDTASERWQYVPDIDAKFMVDNSRTLTAGQNMTLQDADVIGANAVAVLIDTLTINESESAIPTYKVTLRDRKRKTFTESEAVPGVQSKPVVDITEAPQTYTGSTDLQDSYFELDENNNVTLKSAYQNLWVSGWMAAGGVGTGGGGGGGSNVSWGTQSGYTIPLTVDGVQKTLLLDGALTGYALQSSVPTALSQLAGDTTHRVVSDDQISSWNAKGSVSSVTISSGTGITVTNSGEAITGTGTRTISISTTYQNRINHGETAYGWGDHAQAGYLTSYTETDPTVPSWAKQSSLQFSALPALYVGKTPVKGTNTSNDTLIGIDGFTTAASASASGDKSLVVWEPNAGGNGVGAWHFKGNIYADGWIAAGGIGSGSGGGGGTDLDRVWESLTNNTDKPNVQINIAHIPDISTAKITNLESWISAKGYVTSSAVPTESTVAGWGFTKNTGTVTSVTLTQGTGISITNSGTAITTSGTRTISITSTYRNYITHGEDAYSWGDHRTMGYLTQHQDLSGYALKTGGSDYQFLVSQLKFSNGYLSGGTYNSVARPQWTYGSTTKNLAYVDEIPTSLKNPYSLTFGNKTYDGSANRTILASDLGALTSHQTIYALTLNAGSFTSGTYTPNSASKTFNIPTTLDHIGDGSSRKYSDFVHIAGTETITGAKTFTTSPVTIGSDSGISVHASSYIDIGDARLIYDSGANAIHITRRTGGTSRLVGLFADGFVSAGGVGTQSTFSYVTLESDQTVAGAKTFVNPLSVNISGVELEEGDPVPDALTVTGNTTLTGNASITGGLSVVGNINASTFGGGLSINSDEINYGSRLYIQYNSSDLCLTKNGKTVIGTYPGSSAIGTNKLYVGGTAIATTWNTSSDARLKDDISYLAKTDAIEKLMRLKPATWKWNSGLAKGHTASGFIAQEVEPVLPFMVTGEDYKGLAYQMLHAYEVSAIQSHEERLRALEKKMKITEG